MTETQKKYFKSKKGKAALKRAIAKYHKSAKGKAMLKAAMKKYHATAKGKAAHARSAAKEKLKKK